MTEQVGVFLTRVHIPHLNVLLLLGLALFGGTVGGRLFQKLKIPQVVGYIAIGVFIGESGLRVVDQQVIQMLQPFNYFALGLIGFMVGGELHKSIFKKYGRQFMAILLCEGVTPFLLVSVLTGFIGSFFFDWRLAWSLGLLFGAIASATDPATTTEVFREYRTKGPLTTTATGIVALDDGLALMLFAIASSVAGVLIGKANHGILKNLIHPVLEITGSLIVGAAIGFLLSAILKRYSEKERLLAFSLGGILIAVGISLALNVELLLVTMTAGIVVVNYMTQKSKEVFKLIGAFTPPIYVLFFVLIGAKLNLRHMLPSTFILIGIYLFGTMAGKFAGSLFGARICGAPKSVQKYLPFSLFSQAGVAIGLSILAAQYFPGELGNILVVVITTTTFILQIIGPPFTKFAVTKAQELGLNITEEDLLQEMQVKEIMDQNPPFIYNDMHLDKIIKTFSQSNNLYYPVVDARKQLLGIITVDNIKNTLMETGLDNLLLAVDVMEPAHASVNPEAPLFSVKEIFDRQGIEYLPVLTKEGRTVGFIERRAFNKSISTKIIELQKKADLLESGQ
ncbi:cation:proton antiporter [Candidatus Omnitrophota bacterium]